MSRRSATGYFNIQEKLLAILLVRFHLVSASKYTGRVLFRAECYFGIRYFYTLQILLLLGSQFSVHWV